MRLLALLLLALTPVLGCTTQDSTPDAGDAQTVSLAIEGMTWATGCAPVVEQTLSQLEGVQECKVDFGSKTATCKVAKGTDPSELLKALDGTKFSGKVQ